MEDHDEYDDDDDNKPTPIEYMGESDRWREWNVLYQWYIDGLLEHDPVRLARLTALEKTLDV